MMKQKDTYMIFTSDKIASNYGLAVSKNYINLLAEGKPELTEKTKLISSPDGYIDFLRCYLELLCEKKKNSPFVRYMQFKRNKPRSHHTSFKLGIFTL